MIRNGDQANFSLRCDEAIALRKRRVVSAVASPVVLGVSSRSPFERSPAECRESALGLARFKLAQGDVERALAISQQFGLSLVEIGLGPEAQVRSEFAGCLSQSTKQRKGFLCQNTIM